MPTVDFEAYLAFDFQGKPFGVAELLAQEDEADIEYVVVMPANNGPGPEHKLEVQPNNQRLGELIQGERRCVGCATVNPTLGPENVKRQIEIADRFGFRGTKLMGVLHKYEVDDAAIDPVMEATRERGWVASIHSGKDDVVRPFRIANIAARYPDVPIIMDHMGYPDHVEEAIRAAEEHPNIYLGTTILRFFPEPSKPDPTRVGEAVRRVGAERVVWGSNAPEYGHNPLWCRQAIESLKLGAEAERLIMGDTLARLYKIA